MLHRIQMCEKIQVEETWREATEFLVDSQRTIFGKKGQFFDRNYRNCFFPSFRTFA